MSCGSNSDAKPDFDLIWAEYSVILLFFSKTMKKDLICKFLQSDSVRIKCFVYMQRMNASAIFSALAKNHAFNHFYIILYFMHERLKRL